MIYVGMDDSKKSINVAALSAEGELKEAKISNTMQGLRKLVGKLQKHFEGEPMQFAYEAGPGGFVLQRRLEKLGQSCMVAAPSLTPQRRGSRIKTNQRDALELARMLRGQMLEEVHPPGEEEEADRELCRCRGKIAHDLARSRNRLNHFLLRRGCRFSGTNWTQAHRRWLRRLKLEQGVDQRVLEMYLWQVEQLEQNLASADQQLERLAQTDRHREMVAALRCYRGIDTVTAISFVCELYSFGRFESPRGLMNFLGLVPSEGSTGEGETRGPITKTGNRHVRRLLVEAAKHYRHRPAVGVTLRRRRKGQPGAVTAHADKAMTRLHQKYVRMQWRGKESNKITVAVARELAGFLWATLTQIMTQRKENQAA